MNPSSVPLQPSTASSLEKRLDIANETTKLHTVSGVISNRTFLQPLAEDAWSMSDRKRLFDLVLAVSGLILFFPLMVLIGIVVGVSSPGPVLFR
jgi:lipopolysaccharide/colanic/teichoic acid biosynthesis glycosyltransferase